MQNLVIVLSTANEIKNGCTSRKRNPCGIYKAKANQQKRQIRAMEKVKLTANQLKKKREKDRQRQAKCRTAKKANTCISTPTQSSLQSTNSPANKSSQSFGKAYERVRASLSKKSSKVRAVVQRLTDEMACCEQPPRREAQDCPS